MGTFGHRDTCGTVIHTPHMKDLRIKQFNPATLPYSYTLLEACMSKAFRKLQVTLLTHTF